ncbi:MAG: AI-2E family transporter [Clostridiales bacterium]|nr:AI-2E family transporter [Clostridiales bacterium]
MTDNERYIRDRATVMGIIKYLLIAAVIVLIGFFATRVMSVLVPFLIGFLLAKTSHAMAKPFAKLYKKPGSFQKARKRIEIVIYVILLVFICLVAIYGIFALWGQVARAFNTIQNYAVNVSDINDLEDAISKLSESNGGFIKDSFIRSVSTYIEDIQADLVARIPGIVSKAVSSIWSIVGSIPYWIFVIISIMLSGYYFISDGPYVMKMYMKNVPNKSFRRSSLSLINDLSVTLFRALGGYLLLLIITMAESWIAFHLAGVEYALVLALITAILDFLPVLGISATMIPVMIYCAVNNNYKAVIILIIAMAIMTVIRRLIEPAIVGKSLHLHPLLMLISMALGVYIWGAVGFLMGPVVFIIILDIFKVFGLDKKLMVFFSRMLEKIMRPADDTSTAEEA